MDSFAKLLKTLRQNQDLSMQALADKAKVSKSMICKIEREEVQPTLDVARRLANALGKTLSQMLHTSQEASVYFIPKSEQAVWEDAHHVKRRNISPVSAQLNLEWLQLTVPPKTILVKDAQARVQKFFLVTRGVLTLKMNDQVYEIKESDSFSFDADQVHEISNETDKVTEFYVVVNYRQ